MENNFGTFQPSWADNQLQAGDGLAGDGFSLELIQDELDRLRASKNYRYYSKRPCD
jgi:hypothetical protein